MRPAPGEDMESHSVESKDSPKDTKGPCIMPMETTTSTSTPTRRRFSLSRKDSSSSSKRAVYLKPVSFWSLYRYADKWDWLFMVLGVIGAIANGVAMPVFSIIFGDVMNSFGLNLFNPSALKESVDSQIPKFLYLGIGSAVAALVQTFFLVYSSVRQSNRMRSAYLASVLSQDVGYFDTVGTSGALLQGLNEDCATIQAAIGERVAMFVFMMSTAIAGIVIAFTRGWDMTLVLLSLLPVLAGTGYAMSVLVARIIAAMNKSYANANSMAQQALSNVRTVYAFNGEERTVTEYDSALEEPLKVGIKQGFYAGVTTGMANCVAYCGYALAMWYGAQRVAEGEYTGGEVLNVLFSALIGGFALGQAVPNFQGLQTGKVSGASLYYTLNRKSRINADDDGLKLQKVEGVVELRDVTFAYPARPDKPVFDGFNLIVPAGQTVALVGESGSGKSTVVQLIERFYDPQAGLVLLDGVELKKLQLRWLRSQIGLVSQEPTLFATTIRQNILFGKPGSTQEEVIEAAKAANAHKFISALPEGYDTHVGEKGVQMSGGQKQRIAIARAILKDPSVLLLDEATSALDAESEHVVQEALDKLMVGRTTVVVAHRLSTVRNADCIAVVKDGHIVEQGTHGSLIAAAGVYALLVQMQNAQTQSSPSRSRYGSEASNYSGEEIFPYEEKESPRNSPLPISDKSPRVSRELPAVQVERTSSRALERTEAGVKLEQAPEAAVDSKSGAVARVTSRPGLFRRRKKGKEKETATAGATVSRKPSNELVDKKVPLSRIAGLNRPEMPAAFGGLLGSVAMGMLMPTFSLAFSSLINVFYLSLPDQVESGARKWSLIFVGIGFGALIAATVQSFCFNFMGQRLGRRVRVLMMQALLRQEVGWFDDERNSSGVLTSKLSADALAVKGQFGDTMGLITQNLVTLIAGYAIAGFYSWRMMLVVTAAMPVMGVAVYIQSRLILRYFAGERETFATANATASEAFGSIRTVAAFGMEAQITELYTEQLKEPSRKARGRIISTGLGFGFFQFVVFGIFSLAFWYAGIEVSNAQSSFVDVLRSFFAIFLAAFSASQAQMHFPDVSKGQAASRRVFAVIDRKPLIDASDPGGLRPSSCTGKVELRDITFAYPQRPDAVVFQDFSLTVPAGKTVAIVGESGSGKSTVVQLIERFYDPFAGAILLDDVDIRTLNLHWLRSQVGLVSQEPVLFSMTVAENIRYGRPEASLESVIAAAKAANAHTFIEALPEGYNTLLGEGAIQLSGGQKQRVAIARAVVKDPRVLLLDEATSALDAESERVVQDALDKLMVGRTTIVIAHRLSTVKDADSIAVVYKGHLVEQGTHRDLVAAGGAYARLVAHQLLRV